MEEDLPDEQKGACTGIEEEKEGGRKVGRESRGREGRWEGGKKGKAALRMFERAIWKLSQGFLLLG